MKISYPLIATIVGFLIYSVSLWGAGMNQPRDENEDTWDEQHRPLYIAAIIFVFIGLMLIFSGSFFGCAPVEYQTGRIPVANSAARDIITRQALAAQPPKYT